MSDVQDIPIIMSRNQRTGDYQFPQTHVNGVIGLDEYIESYITKPDTEWTPLDIEGMNKGLQDGFDNAYRKENNLVMIRINLLNISNQSVIKMTPNEIKYPQEFMINTSAAPIKIKIKPDGNIAFETIEYNKDWSSDDYVYQELHFYAD